MESRSYEGMDECFCSGKGQRGPKAGNVREVGEASVSDLADMMQEQEGGF